MQVAIPRAWEGRATEDERTETIDLHLRVANAIAEREPETARLAMEQHFARSIGDLFRKEG